VNDELKMTWKEAVWPNFRVILQNLLGWTEENHENLGQNSRSPCRDFNQRPPEYEAGVLTARPRRSVTCLAYRPLWGLINSVVLVSSKPKLLSSQTYVPASKLW
jgi:hypothetical protein